MILGFFCENALWFFCATLGFNTDTVGLARSGFLRKFDVDMKNLPVGHCVETFS